MSLALLSKLIKTIKKFPEWSFKINDEKILEDEINEVVGIFEKVGARKILKGSKEDKEIDHIVVEDRNAYNNNIRAERNEERRKTDKNYEEKKEEKKNNDYFDEKNAYGEGYDSYYAQDKQNQIEGLINGDNIPKVGINQMTVDAIKNMVENKESNKNKKKDKHSAKRKEKEKK